MTRYRIYRKSPGETTYISPHEENKLRSPREFPNLDIALAALRRCGIPEYEITRVTKELRAINGAIVPGSGANRLPGVERNIELAEEHYFGLKLAKQASHD